jgi:amidophosphoribosyltransferase
MTPYGGCGPCRGEGEDVPEVLSGRGFGESCGLFGIYGSDKAAHLTYLGLFSQQHRGQESAGIVVSDGRQVCSHKNLGLVSSAIPTTSLDALTGHLAIGHVRYSTTGSSKKPQNVQPLVLEYSKGLFCVAHNGNLVNAKELRKSCEWRGSIFQTSTDSEIVVHLLARPDNYGLEDPLANSLARLRGSYSFLFMTPTSLIAARDPHGFRPLAMGRVGSAVVFASETCAFDLVGATYERDVEPGEIVEVSAKGIESRRVLCVPGAVTSHCIFEHIYFARPDSLVFGDTVHEVRKRLGQRLAKDYPVDADVVFDIPDSGRSAALGYSMESGIPYDRGFVRNFYVGRTFIMPSEDPRGESVDIKLNVVKGVVSGKRVVVVDDSIIRGNTSRKRLRLLREAGAKEIHVRISSPPCRHPCFYGIDFPTHDELIAAKSSVEEIRAHLEVESLSYLTVEGMLSAVSHPDDYCGACFTGEYPEPIMAAVEKLGLENQSNVDR